MLIKGEAKDEQEAKGDLLIKNPNHAGAAWRPFHESEEGEGEESEEESEQDAEERSVAIESLELMLKAIHAA